MKDGDIDYSGYSPSELQQALEGINPKAFPKNYEKLKLAHNLAFPQLVVVRKEAIEAIESQDSNHSKKVALDFYYSSKASISSVVGAGAFLSNPDLYLYALISIPVAFVAYSMLKNRKSKELLLACFTSVSLYSFVIGRFFFENHRLTNVGLLAMLVVLVVVLVLYVMLHIYEKETAS